MTDKPENISMDGGVLPRLENISIVLSHTTEPQNIGAAARAMKNMGLGRLQLINPRKPFCERSRVMAHGAEDVLEGAQVLLDLKSAIGDKILVAGTTARKRELRKHAILPPADLARMLVEQSANGPVALLFGTERTGLTNDEVYACRYVTMVDADTAQSSLNLAQAVMVYCYEIRKAYLEMTAEPGSDSGRRPEMFVSHPHRSTKIPTQFQLDTMYGHLGAVMEAVGYSEEEQRKFLTYLRHLHMRAGIVDWEMQTYHLLARKILYALGRPPYAGGGE